MGSVLPVKEARAARDAVTVSARRTCLRLVSNGGHHGSARAARDGDQLRRSNALTTIVLDDLVAGTILEDRRREAAHARAVAKASMKVRGKAAETRTESSSVWPAALDVNAAAAL